MPELWTFNVFQQLTKDCLSSTLLLPQYFCPNPKHSNAASNPKKAGATEIKNTSVTVSAEALLMDSTWTFYSRCICSDAMRNLLRHSSKKQLGQTQNREAATVESHVPQKKGAIRQTLVTKRWSLCRSETWCSCSDIHHGAPLSHSIIAHLRQDSCSTLIGQITGFITRNDAIME